MATTPFAALSIHHFISSVGADAGFAAVIGLAVLVLLFFAQARETAALRRRADEAEGQLEQLAMYVEQISRRPAAVPAPVTGATPVPAPPPAAARIAARQAAFPAGAAPAGTPAVAAVAAGAEGSGGGAVATIIPAAPAGVGAPALSSATRLIPVGAPDEISIRSLKNGDGNGAPAAPAVAPTPPAPSTAAGGANGVARAPVTSAVPAGAAVADVPAPRAPLRPQGPPSAGRPAPPPTFRDPVPPSRPRFTRFGVIAASVVTLVIVVVAVLVLVTSGGGSTTTASSSASSSRSTASTKARARSHSRVVAVTPSAVTVAVLNGTSTTHLAADIMNRLTATGFKSGATTNAPTQTVTATTVGYTQPAYRADALAVAKSLKLGPGAVQGASSSDRTQACPGTGPCPAQVIVTVGSDLASAASAAASGSGTSSAPGATTPSGT